MGNNLIKFPEFLQNRIDSIFVKKIDERTGKIKGIEFSDGLDNKCYFPISSSKVSDDVETLEVDDNVSNIKFKQYNNLSDKEILEISRLCAQEQGSSSIKGCAAEASLMANYFEVDWGGSYKGMTGAEGLYHCIKESGYWENSVEIMENGSEENPTSEKLIEVIQSVLVDGKRTMPKYVTQHVSLDGIANVKNNGSLIDKYNSKDYIPHVSVIEESSDVFNDPATWIFYSYPDNFSDPFGYHNEEVRKKYGDEHYSFEDLGIN